jgi:hypothetical protein
MAMICCSRQLRILITVTGGILAVSAAAVVPAVAAHTASASKPGSSHVLHYTVTTNSAGTTVRFAGPHSGAVVRIHGRVTKVRHGVAHAPLTAADRHSPRVSATCALASLRPTWTVTGHIVSGSGHQSCVGGDWQPQRVKVAVQWYLGLGLWSNRAVDGSSFTDNDFTSWTTDYVCSGTGTHTYRTVTDGYTAGGATDVTDPSSSIRLTCR